MAEKPILFLDFDGVLNSNAYFALHPGADGVDSIDRRAVGKLNALVGASDCQVVISSSWRKNTTLQELRKILCARGFEYPGAITGKTPFIKGKSRSVEISSYLARIKGPPPYAILDDDDDMGAHKRRHVQILPKNGLTDQDVNRTLKLLRT